MKYLFCVCAVAMMSLGMQACLPEGDGGSGGRSDALGDTSGTSGGVDIVDDEDVDAAGFDTSGVSFDTSGSTPALKYYFVRINDQSTNSGTNPGADIDAVSITKANTGERVYANRIEDYGPVNLQDISGVSVIAENILGEPTAFGIPFDPANAGSDLECSLDDENYVTLGGVGGYIIVSFGDAHIENGDTITVYEIGNCNDQGVADPIEVQVSVSAGVDDVWVTVFSAAAGPVMSGIVKDLPATLP